MKSLLIAKGYGDNDLKTISHHLHKAVAACSAEDIVLTDDFQKYCEVMGSAHGQYLIRYAIRTFPWIGYDEAVAMIIAQMELLLWPWPYGVAKPVVRALSSPDERVMGAMGQAAERVLDATARAAIDLTPGSTWQVCIEATRICATYRGLSPGIRGCGSEGSLTIVGVGP